MGPRVKIACNTMSHIFFYCEKYLTAPRKRLIILSILIYRNVIELLGRVTRVTRIANSPSYRARHIRQFVARTVEKLWLA